MRKTIAAAYDIDSGSIARPNRKLRPAMTKDEINMIPLASITAFCSDCSSLASSLFRSKSGALTIMTMPAQNIGINRTAIRSRPCI